MAEPPFNEALAPIVHRLISRSPPGQLADVLVNCRRLMGGTALPADLTRRACSDSNEKGLLLVSLGTPDGRMGVVCEAARMGSRGAKEVPYLDPPSDNVFSVDQELQERTSMMPRPKSRDIKAEMEGIDQQAAKPFREAVQRRLDRYCAEHFPVSDGSAAGCVYASQGKEIGGDIELFVIICSRRSRSQAYWTGTWNSQWRICFVPEQQETAQLGGIIEFETCYSEDGNVHFRRKARKSEKVSETTDPERFAAELVNTISRLEEGFHAQTEDVCDSYGTGALKAMRRVLPLSKERFDWRPIRHSLVRDMKTVGKDGRC